MKKSIAIGLIVTLLIGLITAIPVFAKGQPNGCRAVFESDIIDIDTEVGDDLGKGEVWFREDGSFKVEIEGESLVESEVYTVILYNFLDFSTTELGTITINEDGEGVLTGNLYDAGIDIEDMDVVPYVVIVDDEEQEQFVNGFHAPPEPA